jgi:hypothetical protein
MEVWKDVVGYEGLYQVSDRGNVRSVDRYVPHKTFGKKFCKGVVIEPKTTNAGYLRVNLCKENRYKSFSVHRLVAEAFLSACDVAGLQVNHKDENKQNNSVENLEWVTRKENNNYGTKIDRQAKKVKIPVLQYDKEGNLLGEWESATDAEKALSGKFTGAVSHCINGKTKSAFGFIWKFKEVT